MRERRRMSYLVGILTLCLAVPGLYVGTSFAKNDGKGFAGKNNKNAHWTQKHIRKVPPIMMYEPYFSEMFDQTDRDVPYNYEEAVKLAGHSCGATSSAWEMTRIALEILYPDETPVRGNIMVYAPGAEDEWNIGVIGEVITYITGAAAHTGFSGAEFAEGFTHPMIPEISYPGDPIYNRRNKMVYNEGPVGTMPPNRMIWKFERIDTDEAVCLRVKFVDFPRLLDVGIKPNGSLHYKLLGAKLASPEDETDPITEEEIEDYVWWWNARTEDVFENTDSLVVVLDDCDDWPVVPLPVVPLP